jgi:hypothetical protein
MRELKPFDPSVIYQDVSVIAHVQKTDTTLRIQFIGDDPHNHILLQKKDSLFQRSQELWTTTCFECFFAEKGKENYWELNLDHSGNWNLYSFDGYRNPQPPREEKLVKQLELEFLRKTNGFEIQCDLDLSELGLQEKSLDVGLSCVIEWTSHEKSYFALKHCTQKPDFHLRETFICSLE